MLLHVTWEQDGDEAGLRPEIKIPDCVETDDIASYLEGKHGATVKQWKPLTRRDDPAEPQPLTCPQCDSERFDEVGYVDYVSRMEMSVTAAGTECEHDGNGRFGEDYHPMYVECAECDTVLRTIAHSPFEPPDPDALRRRLGLERQKLGEEECERVPRSAIEYENDDGMLPNIEELDPHEAYGAGVEAGIELATGAVLRLACGTTAAYVARNDWRLALLNFAHSVLDEDGARLIIRRPGGHIDVGSRVYPVTGYATPQRMMDVACTRQTRVQNETEGNVYVARRSPGGHITIYCGRHCLLIDDDDATPAAAIPPPPSSNDTGA
jgi:hypothetical protein